jgi:hypothetical protein
MFFNNRFICSCEPKWISEEEGTKLTWKLPHIEGNVAHFIQREGKSYETIISEENG